MTLQPFTPQEKTPSNGMEPVKSQQINNEKFEEGTDY
jgi:hypothetical protein